MCSRGCCWKRDVQIALAKVGKYKHKRWAFQEETRFAIMMLPINPLIIGDQRNVANLVLKALHDNKQLPYSSYFMHLKPCALSNMIVTLNPSASDAQRVLVEALCEKYALGAIVKDSALRHNVKLK